MFDEKLYLEANPDVAAAVRSGAIASGLAHYQLAGRVERRTLAPGHRPAPLPWPLPSGTIPSRRDRVLAGLELETSRGVEIGALQAPLITPQEGNIIFVDHAGTEELKAKYASAPDVNTDDIVDVTGIWGERSLFDCVGGDFDFVLASHVVEHVPDLVTWLQEVRSILKPNGSLRLAVPDRRYTFDYYRAETRLHDVLDAYLQRARRPLPRLVLEHFSMIRTVDTAAIWRGEPPKAFEPDQQAINAAMAIARDALFNERYHDTHCWVFTPDSFRDIFEQLRLIDLAPFKIDEVMEPSLNEIEFVVHLSAA